MGASAFAQGGSSPSIQSTPQPSAVEAAQPVSPAAAPSPVAPSSSVQKTPALVAAAPAALVDAPGPNFVQSAARASKQQPKRILGIMPNYRTVSSGEIPPPPTPKEALKLATQNTFDYSSFLFTGVTSLEAEANNSHPTFGKGVSGFGRYYWRGFVDKTDGNYLVIFALPTVFHEDERFYAKGEGGVFQRGIYAASRVLITPDYHGHSTINGAELLGRGMAQAIAVSYYPDKDATVGSVLTRYAFALGRDAMTNTFREFWPDIATHLLRRNP